MDRSLADKVNALVLVVEPAASVRMMIMEVLRGLGYERLHGVASGKDALSVLEVEDVRWMILPLLASDAINALHLLKLITIEPRLKNTATTLLIEPNSEDFCVPLAFELGLLSWHPKSYVREALQGALEEALALFAMCKENHALTASEYLRRFLTEKRLYRSRAALEQNLLAMYPGSGRVLVHMAEAEIFAGNETRASVLLRQAEVIDTKLAPVCQHLREKHSKALGGPVGDSKENILGMKSVMIVDPDTDVLYAASEMLQQLGVTGIETFEDGQKAFEWLSSAGQEPDLIIMEWRIPGLSGPILVQRIRQAEFIQVPIIVASSLIKREEKPLLIEMGVDEVIEKPFESSSFYSVIIWAIQQNKMPTEQKSLERKIRRLLAGGKKGEAERLIAQMLSDPRVGEGAKKGIKAEFSFSLGDYRSACDLGVEAFRLGGDSLNLLNLVGKSLLKLNQFEKALKCFEKANALCSINIERLLNVAEINLHLDRKQDCAKMLDAATALDPNNPLVLETQVKADIDAGNVGSAAKIADDLESVPRVASYINNRAVALSRSGRFEDGIELYKRAVQCLSGRWSDLAASVTYNLGLAYARYGDYEECLKVIAGICSDPKIPVHRKAAALRKRVDLCIKSGTQLFADQGDGLAEIDAFGEGQASAGDGQAAQQHLDELVAKITAKRGDIGCYLIFNCIEDVDPRATAMLANMPRFTRRKSIERDETFGNAAGGPRKSA